MSNEQNPAPVEPRSSNLNAWLDRVRSSAQSTGPLPSSPPRWSWRLRQYSLFLAPLVLSIPVLTWLIVDHPKKSPILGEVRGTVCDKRDLPVANAWVFMSFAPAVETHTNAKGEFVLGPMPAGEHYIVVATGQKGQEYRVKAYGHLQYSDAGTLRYIVERR